MNLKNQLAWAVVLSLPLLMGAKGGCGGSGDAGASAGGGGGSSGDGGTNPTGGTGNGPPTGTGIDWPEQEGVAEGNGAFGEALAPVPAICAEINPNLTARLFDLVPSDANAEGSAVLAREALDQSHSPIPVHLRTQELLKHYAPKLSSADDSVLVQLRQSADIPELFELLVAVQAPVISPEARPSVVLTLVVDTSSSMLSVQQRAGKAVRALAGALREGDVVNWLTSDPDTAPIRLEIAGVDDTQLTDRADALVADIPEEATSFDGMVAQAYETAINGLTLDAWNRVIVITDGEDELSAETHQNIKDAAMTHDLLAVAVGVGKALERSPRIPRLLSHAGRGPYIQLDDTNASVLNERFIELVGKSYDDLKLSLSVPWFFEVERPYLFETTSLDVAERQYLAPGQVALFPFRLTACDINALEDLAVFEITINRTDGTGADASLTASPTLGDLRNSTLNTELGHVFAVLAYAEALRAMDSLRLQRAHQLVTSTNNTALDPGLTEIAALLLKHPAYPL